MSWRDQLRPASFRGVPFFWHSADTELGRRTARHDYPQRDDVYLEDMGKIPREFWLDLYVIGPDYMAARDRLAEAFETPGPGTLVHPTMGTLSVVVSGRVRLRESTSEGGIARFSALFVLSSADRQPSQTIDQAATVSTQAADAVAVTKENFTSAFSVANQPAFVQNSAIAAIRGAASNLTNFMNTLPTTAGISSILSEIRRFESTVASAILYPKNLADSLNGMVTDALGMFEPAGRISMALSAYDEPYVDITVNMNTPSRMQEANNLQAVDRLMKVSALAVAAEAATQVDYPAVQDAAATRTAILTRMDDALATMPDEIKAALVTLRTALLRFYRADAADLSRVVTIHLPITLPALVVAHNLYGDATRAGEIVSRNRLPHSGFVPGGVPLEVLTNA